MPQGGHYITIQWVLILLLSIINVISVMLAAGGILSVILSGWWYCPALFYQRFLEEVGSGVI